MELLISVPDPVDVQMLPSVFAWQITAESGLPDSGWCSGEWITDQPPEY